MIVVVFLSCVFSNRIIMYVVSLCDHTGPSSSGLVLFFLTTSASPLRFHGFFGFN